MEDIYVPKSMLTCVIGFPAGSYIGFPSTSIFEVETPGRSTPETWGAFLPASFLTAAGFVAMSLELVLCGIFRISLYLGWLQAS